MKKNGTLVDIRAISLVTQAWNQSVVFFEEAEENIATNGPKGTKIVQYFGCQKFVEMAFKNRFQELKSKGYCF